jgi:hypothetical protein
MLKTKQAPHLERISLLIKEIYERTKQRIVAAKRPVIWGHISSRL